MSSLKCATPVCSAIPRRTVLRERYCEPCAASVEQAAYLRSLSPAGAGQVLYRHSFGVDPPQGVTLPEPLMGAPRCGRSRR